MHSAARQASSCSSHSASPSLISCSVMPARCGLVCHAGSVRLGLSCRLGVAGSDHPSSVWLSLTMPARCGLVCHASSVWPGVMPTLCGWVCHASSVWPGPPHSALSGLAMEEVPPPHSALSGLAMERALIVPAPVRLTLPAPAANFLNGFCFQVKTVEAT